MKVGILGFGHLGQFLAEELPKLDDFELAFVWNRTTEKLKGVIPDEKIIEKLEDIPE